MGEWAVILGITRFKVIHNQHVTVSKLDKVVKMGLSSSEAMKLATELNEVMYRQGY